MNTYVARTLLKCGWVCIGSYKSYGFFDDPTWVCQHFWNVQVT